MLATYLFVSLKKTPFNSWNSLNLIPFYIYTLSLLHNYKLPKNIVLFSDLTIFIPIWINISQIWIYCNSIIYYGVAKLRNRNLELPWYLEHEFDTSKEGIQLLLSAIYEENNYLREIRDSCKLDLVIKEKQLKKQTEYWTCGRGLTQTNEMFFQTLLTVKL